MWSIRSSATISHERGCASAPRATTPAADAAGEIDRILAWLMGRLGACESSLNGDEQ